MHLSHTPQTRPWASPTSQQRIGELSERIPTGNPDAIAEMLGDSIVETLMSFDRSINLYAGANRMSSLAKAVAAIEIGSRPTLGDPGEKFPSGVDPLDALEIAAGDAVRASVGAKFAEVRPFSATMANLAAYMVFTRPGDTIAALPEPAGGHISHHSGAPSVRGLQVESIPYSYVDFDIDFERLPAFLERVSPKLIVVGGNLMLRPLNLPRLVEIARSYSIPVLYDASHVAGLIAGGEFQDPLGDGVDVLTFSTYKSYGGPAGGAICTNDAVLAEKLSTAIYPTLSANYDVHRLAPLAVTANERVRNGAQYARACIDNAQALGAALAAHNIDVLGAQFGYTNSHHLAVDVREYGGGKVVSKLLEAAGIYCSPTILPISDTETVEHGLRFGTQELTSRGVEIDMFTSIGELVAELVTESVPLNIARDRVAALTEQMD